MQPSKQTKQQSSKNEIKSRGNVEQSGFEAPIEDVLPSVGVDHYSPDQVLQLQRIIGNKATIQLMRKNGVLPNTIQRDTQSGGLPPPPPENDTQSGGLPPPPQYDEDNKDEKGNDPPPFFSESTGLGSPQFEDFKENEQQTSSIDSLSNVDDPIQYATRALGKYITHLQQNPNDKTFTNNWQDWEIERLAEGWVEMDEKQQKNNQYAISQLVLENQKVEEAVSAKQFEKSDENIGKKLELAEHGLNASMVVSAGFSVGTGVELAIKLKDGIGAVLSTTATAFEKLLSTIIGFAWLPLLIGYEAVKAFHYHKRRRDGFKTRVDALEGKQDKTKDEAKLYDVAKYGYKKTRRAFSTSMAKIALRVVRMIALIITVLTGGTTAAVTGAIAAISAIVESSETLYRKIKGFGKWVSGSRGANRKKNAEELVKLAKGGNTDAAQTILDVNPFDELTMKTLRKLANKLPTSLTGDGINPITNSRDVLQGLSKPQSPQDLIFLLQNRPEQGGWTSEHETMLERALANTMVSQ